MITFPDIFFAILDQNIGEILENQFYDLFALVNGCNFE
jgi:hypothetical protein